MLGAILDKVIKIFKRVDTNLDIKVSDVKADTEYIRDKVDTNLDAKVSQSKGTKFEEKQAKIVRGEKNLTYNWSGYVLQISGHGLLVGLIINGQNCNSITLYIDGNGYELFLNEDNPKDFVSYCFMHRFNSSLKLRVSMSGSSSFCYFMTYLLD